MFQNEFLVMLEHKGNQFCKTVQLQHLVIC